MDDVTFGLSVIAFKCKETIYWIYQEIQNGVMIWIGKQQLLFIGILTMFKWLGVHDMLDEFQKLYHSHFLFGIFGSGII